ncbi:hypothetical protein [Tessaracoccus antarcticus]|uniref:Uncharacterized protein n=1 Tax=Tessaracoccus antarcticus TaxID=2479848 RepID=A0A3M0G9D0_9ACTN|nr:hypothetical protein [Tessaracoccus antarcticus]RMB61545.1 hypothetical protein EAX62_02590 [Tessaracoccus antarcticus]
MSRIEMTSRQKAIMLMMAAVGLTILVGVGLLLRERAPGNMGNGFLVGAGVAIVAALIMGWRATRSPSAATSFERAWTSLGDERDDAVLTKALAFLGVLALPLTGVAALAIGLGADVPMVLVFLMTAEALAGIIAFAVTLRRN